MSLFTIGEVVKIHQSGELGKVLRTTSNNTEGRTGYFVRTDKGRVHIGEENLSTLVYAPSVALCYNLEAA